MDLDLVIDESFPPHVVYVTADGGTFRVTVSPRVEAGVLVALNREIAEHIAAAVDSSVRDS